MRTTLGQEVIAKAIQNSWKCEYFKSKFISDPVKVLEQISGGSYTVAVGCSLRVVDRPDIQIADSNSFLLTEESAEGVISISIPAEPELGSIRLTDRQLESIAAGDHGQANALIQYLLLPLILA